MLMSLMATELANEAKDVGVRQSAGLVLKNCLSSKVGIGWHGGSEWASACGGVGMRACERACVRACVRASELGTARPARWAMEPEPEPRALPWQDDAKQEALAAQWLAFDAAGKAQIKNAVFGCLGSSQRGARDVAAQVVSAAATIELPRGEWLDVIQVRV